MVIIWYMVIINGEWWFIIIWLVVLTILKNMSQWEGWHPIYDMENNNWLKPPTSDKQLEITGHHLEWLIVISSYFKKVMICYDSNNLIFNLRFKLLISITCAVLIPSSRARHCYSNWWCHHKSWPSAEVGSCHYETSTAVLHVTLMHPTWNEQVDALNTSHC
jgi:hypothetical protein